MSLNSFAHLYEEATIVESRKSVLDILDNHAPQLHSEMSILDLACGSGTVTRVIYEQCATKNIKPPRLVGVDIGDMFIDAFNANKKAYGWETAEGFVGDASDLHMCKDNEFDLVIMSYGLFAVADAVANKVAAEIRRVLKPGGRAFFTVWRDNFVSRMLQGANKGVGRPQEEIDRHDLGKWSLAETSHNTLVAGGFEPSKVTHFRHDDTFGTANQNSFLDRFDMPFWKNIGTAAWTDDQKPRWRAEVEKVILKEQEERGGLQANCWIFVAEK
ncbi:unnamed protein product [Clonostachys rosea]|uniref:Methyltransferase domain-containing protein n=1 Tax=Bionectria ochroleuca TaxID=29856 RepID=A0ABY6UIC3_BIOOC|nr:unnamed protein product [Clonostachys rosea]